MLTTKSVREKELLSDDLINLYYLTFMFIIAYLKIFEDLNEQIAFFIIFHYLITIA